MLTVHATIEEEIFYPAARLDEAEVEHASAKELIAQIELMKASDPLYDAKDALNNSATFGDNEPSLTG